MPVLVAGEMGNREIGKLIELLEAQKAILEDDDEQHFKERLGELVQPGKSKHPIESKDADG